MTYLRRVLALAALLESLMRSDTTTVVLVMVMALMISPAVGETAAEAEHRVVSESSQPQHILLLDEPMVFKDLGISTRSRGIRIPAGAYIVEAEDADYLYYRSEQPIEYRIFDGGTTIGDRMIPGGIYLSKGLISLVPAGAYMSVDDTHKVLTWKLGVEFMHLEGSKWHRADARVPNH